MQLLKETGARIGEAWALKWTEVDFERPSVSFVPEKGSRPRQFKISPRLHAMIGALPRKSITVFGGGNLEKFRRNYEKQRAHIARDLGNPRLRISLLRHQRAHPLRAARSHQQSEQEIPLEQIGSKPTSPNYSVLFIGIMLLLPGTLFGGNPTVYFANLTLGSFLIIPALFAIFFAEAKTLITMTLRRVSS